MARSHRQQVVYPEVIRRASVIRTSDISANMRRIVLNGPELGNFVSGEFEFPAMRSEGFDDFVRLFFPTESGEVVLPQQKCRSVEWPREPKPVSRNYTMRLFDARKLELTMDFVTHDTGVASTWGRRCAPGDEIALLGPVRSGLAPEDVDWILAVGDETALPAIARWLEEMPSGTRAQVVIEVATAEHEIPLPTAADVNVTWVHRPIGFGAGLDEAVRGLRWWDGTVFAWVAGESTALKSIRNYLRRERGLPAEMVEVTGYWRRASVVTLADDPTVPDLAAQEPEPFERLAERAEILSPFAIRAANTLRIPHGIAEGADTIELLAKRTSTDSRALAKFVRYLIATDVLARRENGTLVLADIGEAMLADEWVTNWLDLSGIEARVELSMTGLVDSVRSGVAGVSALTNATLEQDLVASDDLAQRHHDHIADEAAFLGAAFAAEYPMAGLSRILLTGSGSGVVLGPVLAQNGALEATVIGMPSEIGRIRADVDSTLDPRVSYLAQSVFAPIADCFDAHVLLEITAHYPDDDLVLLLRNAIAAVGSTGKLIVIERLLDEGDGGIVSEDAAEFDLLMLCMYGTGLRTEAEFASVAARADLRVSASRLIGWGIAVLDLVSTGPAASPT